MLVQRLSRVLAAVTIASFLGAALWGQQKKEWKDRAEYDLYAAASKETNATKRLEILNSWKEKYPQSDYNLERQLFYIATYKDLQQGARMFESASEVIKIDPKNIQGLYWMTLLTTSLADTSPARLDLGEKASRGLLAVLDETFAPDKRPATTSEAAWKKERANLEGIAHTTLGWVAMNRKTNDEAEKQFRTALQLNPNNGQVSYWLATVIVAQRVVEKQAEAFFHFARAANYSGEGAMPDAGRKQVQAYLEKVYVGYHGDKSGLPELVEQARSDVFPPAGFKVESAAEVAARKHQQLVEENPQLALWLSVKKELQGPEGVQYFTDRVKNTAFMKMKGTLISASPEARPKELVLGLANPNTPEVTLKLSSPMPTKAEPGTEIEFEGIPQEFTQDPFNLTFEVEREKIEGWPAPAPAGKKRSQKKS